VRMAKEGKEEWKKRLLVISEKEPPLKVISKGETNLDTEEALAKILNELEQIKKSVVG